MRLENYKQEIQLEKKTLIIKRAVKCFCLYKKKYNDYIDDYKSFNYIKIVSRISTLVFNYMKQKRSL